MVPHFLTDKFPWIFHYFFNFPLFFSILFKEFNKYKNLTNILQLKNLRKHKNWLKFPHFSSILDKILFKILWLFPDWKMVSMFPHPVRTHSIVSLFGSLYKQTEWISWENQTETAVMENPYIELSKNISVTEETGDIHPLTRLSSIPTLGYQGVNI